MNLRPYQQKAVEDTERGWSEYRRQLGVLPTGGGKTIVFSHLAARRMEQRGQRTLILAHREELINQAIIKLHAATGIMATKEKAADVGSRTAPVVVASVQTMTRRLEKWAPDHFGLVVADEAHHAISDSWLKVLRRFDAHANVLGVTATPDRGDKRELGSYFENVAFEVGLFDLVNDGFLCPITVHSVPLKIDLTGVRQQAGDFREDDLGNALEPYLGQIAEAIKEHASFRRVLTFLPLRATSRKFVDACRAAGLTAEHVDGDSPDRAEILERFARWDFDVLSNAMLLTEGFDDPGIDCVVVLRPTRSRPLYAQMVGRGTRVASGKDNLLLLDFLWAHERLSIVHPASLIAKSEEEAQAITAKTEANAAMPADVAEKVLDLRDLASDVQEEREAKLRAELAAKAHRKATCISAEEWALRRNKHDLLDYEPTMKWEAAPVSEKQARVLTRAGIDLDTVKGKGHASQIISILFGSQPIQLASHAQRATMRKLGHPNPDQATAAEARSFFATRNRREPTIA